MRSRTDAEAKLLRKSQGKEAKRCFSAHAAMENRNGLCVLMDVTASVGVTEAEQALCQIDKLSLRGFNPRSVGADSNYHTKTFVRECRNRGVAPHVAAHSARKTPGLDGHKTTGALCKSRYRGIERTGLCAHFVGAACNLVRVAKLMEESPPQTAGA